MLLKVLQLDFDGDDPVIEPGEAPLVFGDQDRGKEAVPVAGKLHTHWAMLGQHRLATGAVALVGLAFGLVLAWYIPDAGSSLRPSSARSPPSGTIGKGLEPR